MENYTFRLKPGQDLFDSIQAFVHEKRIIIFSTRPKILPDFSQFFQNLIAYPGASVVAGVVCRRRGDGFAAGVRES